MSSRTAARIGAPAAFLLAVTVAVLLVRAGLRGHSAPTATTTTVVAAATTTTAHRAAKKPRPAKTATSGASYVTVQSGDTFYSIASHAGISLDQLKALNPGVSPYALHVGERIRVK